MSLMTALRPLRVCRDCGLEALSEKDLDLFFKNKNAPHGRDNWCRKCRAKYFQNRRNMIEEPILCQICGSQLYRIYHNHLNGAICQFAQERLGITISTTEEYIKLFPNAPIVSEHEFQILSKAGKIGSSVTNSRMDKEKKKEIASRLHKIYMEKTTAEYRLSWGQRYAHEAGSKGGKTCWLNMTKDELQKRRAAFIERFRTYWDGLTPEEKTAHGRRGGLAALQKMPLEERERRIAEMLSKSHERPNRTERNLDSLLSPLGFQFNRKPVLILKGDSKMLGRTRQLIPDFVHRELPLIIEHDGPGGHDPSVPWVGKNQPMLDDERDIIYKEKGYGILRITPNDLSRGKEYLADKVSAFVISSQAAPGLIEFIMAQHGLSA